MKNTRRNNIIISLTVIICLFICLLWATVFFVYRAKDTVETSSDTSSETSAESSDVSSEDTVVVPDALDALFACNERVLQASSFSSVTSGYCDTQVLFFNYRHELYSERIADGNELYCLDIGVGSHIRYGVSCYFTDDARMIRLGEVRSLDDVVWKDKPVSLSKKAYAEAFGDVPRGLSVYSLDKDNVKSAILKSYSEDSYTYVYELFPSASSEAYSKKLKQLGALEDEPSVQAVKMTVVMDHSFYPVSVTYEETYSIVLSLIGNTTCKAEYTETFSSFEDSVSIPDRDYLSSFLPLSAVDVCPKISAGYQLLLSFFEDKTAYELNISMSDLEMDMELSADTSLGALSLKGDAFSFLYQNARYHLSHGDIHVYTEAEVFNQYLLPLFSPAQSSGRAQNNGFSELFEGAELKTEDGKLTISYANAEQSFLICIDTASMSLSEAEISIVFLDSLCEISIKKTDKMTSLTQVEEYIDITESVSAVSFLTTLVGANDQKYLLQTDGALQYNADVVLYLDKNLTFSALSSSEDLPIDLYFADQTLCAVWGEVSVVGTVFDFVTFLTSFADSGVSAVSENIPTYLSSISHGKDLLTLYFEGENTFSLTMTSDSLAIRLETLDVKLLYRGASNMSPQTAPPVQNTLEAAALGAFLNDSFYLSLPNAGSLGAYLEMSLGAELLCGDLFLNISSELAAKIEMEFSGLDSEIVYQNDTVFLTNSILNAYVEANRIESVLKRLSVLDGKTISRVGGETVNGFFVTCDGETIRIDYDGTEIILKKQEVVISNSEFTIYASELYALPDAINIAHPAKAECIDLDLLSQRLVPLMEQSAFSFAGTIGGDDFSSTVSRLDFNIDDTYNITSAAIDFLLSDSDDLHAIVYDGEAIYYHAGNIKLFSAAEPLISSLTNDFAPRSVAYASPEQSFDIGSIRSVTYQNDILTLELDFAVIQIKLTGHGVDALNISFDSIEISLQKTDFSPILSPDLEGYVDITSMCDLIPKLMGTAEAGNFDFEGVFDIEVLTMRLRGVALEGTFDYSDELLKGYICIDVPYLYGLTSGGIPLKQGSSLLRSCSIQSEIYILGDRLYLCRTIYATYGYTQPMKIVFTEKRYLTVAEMMQSPEKILSFVLNLDSELSVGKQTDSDAKFAKSSTNQPLLKRFLKLDEKYVLEFYPQTFIPSADSLLVYAETNEQYITSVAIETNVSPFEISIICNLTDHGDAKLDFAEKDFLSYIPLQD